jgi:putative transposase
MKSGGGRDFSPAAMRSGGGRDFSPAGNCLATSRATMARPPRIPEFDYIGPLAVFFTSSTLSRRPAFLDSNVARYAVDQILQVAESCDVEISAYCVMPDHVHILTTGCHDQSETLTSFLRWKQKLGYWYRRQTTEFLWQPGYWDRVLRDEDDLGQAVRYVVANPLRAGLVQDLTHYPWVGSARWTIEELATTCQDCERPSWW